MKHLLKTPLISQQKGFTLIELMISMVVGLSVLGTVAAVFVPSLSTFRNNEAMSSIQENERFSIQTLGSLIDQTGFHGCDSRSPETLVNASNLTATWASAMEQPVQIFSPSENADAVIGASSPRKPSGSGTLPVGDVLTLLSSSTQSSLLIGHNATLQTVQFRGNVVSQLDEKIILLNDCVNSAMFEVVRVGDGYDPDTNITTFSYDTPNNCVADDPAIVLLGSDGSGEPSCSNNTAYASYAFQPGAYATSLVALSLYVAPSSIESTRNNSLWSVSVDSDGTLSVPQEVIFGVDNFRALYGVLGSGGQTVGFVDGATLNSGGVDVDGDSTDETFANIISIKISLLLSSLSQRGDRGITDQQSFLFPDSNGDEVDCGVATADLSACPDFINASVGGVNLGTRLRRNVSKVFNLRNVML